MTPERRAELRALLAKASPGPWTRWKDNLVVWSGEVTDNTSGGLSIKPDSGREIAEFPAWEIDDDGRDREAAANADLVAAAKAALPALLDALDMAEARERRLREMLAECTDDLEARIDAEYPEPDRLSHPVALRRYERDIAPVLNARAALSEGGKNA